LIRQADSESDSFELDTAVSGSEVEDRLNANKKDGECLDILIELSKKGRKARQLIINRKKRDLPDSGNERRYQTRRLENRLWIWAILEPLSSTEEMSRRNAKRYTNIF
jgi:hypothetical protein